LIYTNKKRPDVFPQEKTMKPPIMVSSDDLVVSLDPMSRELFAKVYNIRSKLSWKRLGQVRGAALRSLEDNFNKCLKQNFKLSQAASEGRTKKVIRLLADGADPNAVVGIHGNALFEAISAGHYQVAEILLAKGAAPYLGFAQKMTSSSLHQAISRGNPVL
jgi:ankyrin repeat protein